MKIVSKPNGFCVGLGEGVAVGVSKGEIVGVSSAEGVGVSYGVPGSGGVGVVVGNDGVGNGVRGDREGTREGVGVGVRDCVGVGGVGVSDGVTSVGDRVASGSRRVIVVLFLTIYTVVSFPSSRFIASSINGALTVIFAFPGSSLDNKATAIAVSFVNNVISLPELLSFSASLSVPKSVETQTSV